MSDKDALCELLGSTTKITSQQWASCFQGRVMEKDQDLRRSGYSIMSFSSRHLMCARIALQVAYGQTPHELIDELNRLSGKSDSQ